MAISFVNKSAFASGTNALTVAAVTGVVAGDLVLLFVESANQPVAAPTGFTQVTGSPIAIGTANSAGGVALQVFYQFATGADTTTSVADSGDHTTAIKLAYRGVDPGAPFDATAVTGTKATASTTSTFPGITTTTAGAWVVHATGLDLDLASTATTGAPTNANLTGLTERHDQTIAGGFGGGLVIIDGVKATAGASGNTTATVTSTTQVYLTMALRQEIAAGTFAATETGADTLSATGGPVISGAGAATETGSDTLSATGSVVSGAITGTFAATETGDDTLAATGTVAFAPITGDFAATETGADTLAATGDVIVSGSLAVTETGSDVLAAAGKVIVKGALAATETGSDTATASGQVIVKGSGSAVETGADAAAATGKVIVSGSVSATEAVSDTLASSGKVLVQGAGAGTETANDVLFGSGGAVTSGLFAATETGSDTLAGAGQVVVSGALDATETGADAFASAGQVFISGFAAATESPDSLSSSGAVLVQGATDAAEQGDDALAATGSVLVSGSLAATETADELAGSGQVLVSGSADATESGQDIFYATASAVPRVVGSMEAAEAGDDTLTSAGRVLITGVANASEEGDDTILVSAPVIAEGAFAATEAGSDTFGGYVAPGYIEPGYFDTGSFGSVKNGFNITGAQALLLRRLCQLHGLIDALEVTPTERRAGDLVQSISESNGTVTIRTTSAGTAFNGTPGEMIEELAALHGLTEDLVVTKSSRQAGDIVQAFASSGNSTTVVRQ